MTQTKITYDIESVPIIRNELTLDETDGRLVSDEALFRWLRGKEHIDPRTSIRIVSRQALPDIMRAAVGPGPHPPYRGLHAHQHDHGDGVQDAMHHHDHRHYGEDPPHHGHHTASPGAGDGSGEGRSTVPNIARNMTPQEIGKLSLSQQFDLYMGKKPRKF